MIAVDNTRLDKSYQELFAKSHNYLIESGKSPLLKTGIPERLSAYDPINATKFSGLNGMHLDNIAEIKGYKDPRWVKSLDLQDTSLLPKSNEKGIAVAYLNKFNEMHEGLSKERNSNSRYYIVYNAEQLLGYPSIELDKIEISALKKNQKDKRIIVNNNLNSVKRENNNNLLQEMIVRSNAPLKNVSYAYSSYKLAQELGIEYKPLDIEIIKKESKQAKNNDLLKSAYFGNVQAKKIENPKWEYDLGKNRELEKTNLAKHKTINKNDIGVGILN